MAASRLSDGFGALESAPAGRIARPTSSPPGRLHLEAGTQLSIDVQGEQLVMKRVDRTYPDWRTMRGMARGGESLTEALLEERAAEKAHWIGV